MNVDFPDPDGPMMATNSPAPTESETPRRAGTTTLPIRYSFFRSIASIIVWDLYS
jgi:hypothetical protein